MAEDPWSQPFSHSGHEEKPGADLSDFFSSPQPLGAKPASAIEPSPAREATKPVMTSTNGSIPPRVTPGQEQITADTPWSTVGMAAINNAPASAVNTVKDVASAVYNYDKTIPALGNLAYGIGSKAYGLVGQQDPAEKAKNEAVLDAVVDDYKDKYGSWEGFKKRLGNDPFNIGMDAATLISGGVGAASKLGLVGDASKVASAASMAATAADPVALAAKVVGKVAKPVGEVVGKVAKPVGEATRYVVHGYQAIHSGVPTAAYDIAREAGAMAGKEGDRARQAFRAAQKGELSAEQIADTAERAFNEAADLASRNYRDQKAGITAFNQPLPMDKIVNAAADIQRYRVSGRPLREDIQKAQEAAAAVRDRLNSADKSMRNIEGLDRLKRDIRLHASGIRDPNLKKLVYEMANAAKQTIVDVDPKYAKLMDDWQVWLDDAANMKSALGAGNPRASSMMVMKKLRASLKDKTRREQLDLLAQTDAGKDIPFMLAGHELGDMMPHWMQGGGWSTAVAPAALYALGSGPLAALGAIPGIVSALPKAGGLLDYGAGIAARKMGDIGGTAAKYTGATSALGRNVLQNTGDLNERMGRKSGGRTMINHEAMADRLVDAAERVKKQIGEQTKPLLGLPDEAITHALEVANRSI